MCPVLLVGPRAVFLQCRILLPGLLAWGEMVGYDYTLIWLASLTEQEYLTLLSLVRGSGHC